MNKTVTVNLGGTVFHIDDNAYESLIRYLNAIKGHFSAEQGRDEIMQDIESRIGEMFRERLSGREVVELADVEEVTSLMGRPEEFGNEEEKASKESVADVVASGPVRRRLFRNPDDKLLGGVASGIASYFDVDPVWIRLGLVALIFLYSAGFWIYILLWIIVPKARTTADRLMMRGEPITVTNIERNVKEELDTLRARVSGDHKQSGIARFFSAVGEVIRFFFIALGKVIVAFFVFIGLIVGIALFASLFGLMGAPFVHYPEFLNHIFDSRTHFSWAYFGVVMVVGIPFLMLAYAGIRSIFKIKNRSKTIGFTALGLWVLGLVILLFSGIHVFHEFSDHDNVRKEIPLQQPTGNYLVLETDAMKNVEKEYGWRRNRREFNDEFFLSSTGDQLVSRNIQLDIVKSPTDSFELVEICNSQGPSRKAAIENASRIKYAFAQTDSVLRFERQFYLDKDDKWRAQFVQLVLRVPVGGKVRLDETLRNFIYDVDNIGNIYDDDMINRTWEMTERGLKCLDCTGDESALGGPVIVHGEDGAEIRIDDHGVRVHTGDDDKVTIDSNGVYIRQGGKDVIRIDRNGMKVDVPEDKK